MRSSSAVFMFAVSPTFAALFGFAGGLIYCGPPVAALEFLASIGHAMPVRLIEQRLAAACLSVCSDCERQLSFTQFAATL